MRLLAPDPVAAQPLRSPRTRPRGHARPPLALSFHVRAGDGLPHQDQVGMSSPRRSAVARGRLHVIRARTSPQMLAEACLLDVVQVAVLDDDLHARGPRVGDGHDRRDVVADRLPVPAENLATMFTTMSSSWSASSPSSTCSALEDLRRPSCGRPMRKPDRRADEHAAGARSEDFGREWDGVRA